MDFRVVPAGDAAVRVELPDRIDPGISDRIVALADGIRRECAGLVRDVVVGYSTVTAYFDPLRVDPADLEARLTRLARAGSAAPAATEALVDVPVCYGGDQGPDLAGVAATAGLTEAEAIAIHSGTTYRVYVVGFVPGFAYMAPVDPRLVLPRRATPRTRVPAGSVAIAAGQTGIYPTETPGGWHLIGRTPLKPYDASRAQPFAFKPGDRVRFHAIDRAAFQRESTWP
jgi:KipI family sensor histidine kinase inhibitor